MTITLQSVTFCDCCLSFLWRGISILFIDILLNFQTNQIVTWKKRSCQKRQKMWSLNKVKIVGYFQITSFSNARSASVWEWQILKAQRGWSPARGQISKDQDMGINVKRINNFCIYLKEHNSFFQINELLLLGSSFLFVAEYKKHRILNTKM